jgi:hypothetical protein
MRISKSVDAEEVASGSSSKSPKYEFRVKKPKFSIDLNRHAPDEDYTKFKVEKGDEKDKVKELQTMIMTMKYKNWMIEQWNAKQQEKL